MKTQHTHVTATANLAKKLLITSIGMLLVSLSVFVATSTPVLAVDGVWLANPGSNDWNTGTNWSTSPFAPVNAGDTATFNTSAITVLVLSGPVTIESMTFSAGASSFATDTFGNILTLQGAGIVNNSGTMQTILNNGAFNEGELTPAAGFTKFTNMATAGNSTIANDGGSLSGLQGGATQFMNTSSAGSASIFNIPGTMGGLGGSTEFFNTSTAGSATITNIGTTNTGQHGGSTTFRDTSTAGNAAITNFAGTITNSAGSITVGLGATQFLNASTAGNATITNNGGTAAGVFGGVTVFGSIPIINGTPVSSGADTSSAGSATIINNGGTGGGFGGTTEFLGQTDGGTARVITNGNGNFDISRLTASGMNIGSIEGSGNYFLGSKTLTVGGNNRSTTVSGVIQDGGFMPGVLGGTGTGGSLTKVGTGVLTLTGTNTYTGQTTVDGGGLIVDGSIASAQTVVNPGAFLAGNGVIGGNLVNKGTVVPGNPLGTLTVSGNYTQNATGRLAIGVAGLAPGQFSQLAVNGHASVAGTLLLVPLNGFQFQIGDKLTFLTANGGVSGTFSTVQTPIVSNTLVTAKLVVSPDAIQIEATQGSFATTPGVATTPNELAVAKALDSAAGDPREAPLFAFLNSQPVADLPHDLTLIAPTQISSTGNTGASVGKVQLSNVGTRLANIRAGITGFSSAGFTINGGSASFGTGLAGETGAEGKGGPSVLAPTPENRWGVFVTGLGEFTNIDSTPNAAGFNVDTGGFTVGVDYRLTPNFAIGLDGGYAHTNVSLDGGGNIDVNAGTIGLYATLFGNGFYFDAAISGGPSGYDTHRVALQGNANGSTDGADINFLVAGGYDWQHGNLSIGPTASFQFSYVSTDGFTETGSLAPLTIHDQNIESERSAFGAKASYAWKIGHVTVIPQVSLAWQHEYGSVAYTVVANFATGAGNSFTVSGPQIGRDSLLIGAGVSILWSDRISTYVYYDGEVARTNYDSHSVSGGVRITF